MHQVELAEAQHFLSTYTQAPVLAPKIFDNYGLWVFRGPLTVNEVKCFREFRQLGQELTLSATKYLPGRKNHAIERFFVRGKHAGFSKTCF
jgi:hypothetical protein